MRYTNPRLLYLLSARKMLVLLGSRTDSEEVRLTTAQATRFSMSDPSVYNRRGCSTDEFIVVNR